MTKTYLNYVKGIDGIRAFAVMAVMLFHIYPEALPGGFTGVDVFFVISGYVVSSSLAKNYHPNFFKFIAGFYSRRILRIIPILLVFLFVSSLITTLFIPSSWLSLTTSKTALASFFGYSNFALVWYNDGYFSPRIEFNPFVHTWSLSVEEQFYVIFPFIFFIWYRFKDHASKFISLSAKWILAILLISSLIYAGFQTSSNPDKAFYLLPSRFWELGFGALLFKLHTHNKFVYESSFRHSLFLFFGLILIVIGFQFADEKLFPFPWAIPSVIGTAFLIIGFVNNSQDKSFIKSLFENKIIVYIGKISYSLYLWHWAIYAFFRWTIGLDTLLKMSAAIIITILLSIISYHYIETPFRKNKFIHKQSNWKIILIGLLSIAVMYGGVKLIFNSQSEISLSVTKDKHTWYPRSYPNLSDVNKTTKLDFSDHQIFVIGDSHAGAYRTMLRQLSDEYGIKTHILSTGGCPVASLLRPGTSISNKCIKKTNALLSKVKALSSPGDIVFLASLRMSRLGNQWSSYNIKDPISTQLTEAAAKRRKLALEETKIIIEEFEKTSLHVIIDAPKPIFKSPAFRCSDWFNQSNPVCKDGLTIKRDFLLEYRQPVMDSLISLSEIFPKLTIWDPFPVLCKKETCAVFDSEKPLFFDGDHLSAHGNRILYPSFKLVIENILLNVMSENILSNKIVFNSSKVIFVGWSHSEKSHRWSLDNSSKILFKLKDKQNALGILKLKIGTLGKQIIKLTINGHYIGSQTVKGNVNLTFKFNPNILNTRSINIIEFEFPHAHKPNNGDKRVLAMALRSFSIE